MNKLFFINLLIPMGFSSTDVCFRLYEIRGQLEALVGTFSQNTDLAATPFCDFDDMCRGLQINDEPLSCKDAFDLITRHNERPPIETPPILMPPVRFRRLVNADMAASLRDADPSRDIEDWRAMSFEFRQNIDSLKRVVLKIFSRKFDMFPRLFYDDEIDGESFRELRKITDVLKLLQSNAHTIDCLMVVKFLHRSQWMKLLESYMTSLVRYVAHLSLVDMELAMISIAPTMHAYLYLCSNLEIDFFSSLDWYWLLPLISRYDPLYIREPENLFWTAPTLLGNTSPLSIQIGPDIDMDHFREIVWPFAWSPVSSQLHDVDSLRWLFLCYIEELVRLRGEPDSDEEAVNVEEESAKYVEHLHRLAYTLRYLGSEAERDFKTPLREFMKTAITTVNSDLTASQFQLNHFTRTTLLRITRSHLGHSSIWSFIDPPLSGMPPYWGIQQLNITYLTSGRPKLLDVVNGMISVNPYRLQRAGLFEWNNIMGLLPGQMKSKIDLYSDFLSVVIAEPIFARNALVSGEPFTAPGVIPQRFHNQVMKTHRAAGRIIGVCLRDPTLRHLLVPYWIVGSEPSTILETIFFASHFVRKGVYDVLPYGVLEDMFPDANALVNSLSPLAAPL